MFDVHPVFSIDIANIMVHYIMPVFKGELVKERKADSDTYAIACLSDGRLATAGVKLSTDGDVCIWDKWLDKRRPCASFSYFNRIAFLADVGDGQLLSYRRSSGMVQLQDTNTGRALSLLHVPIWSKCSVGIFADRKLLVTSSRGVACVWDIRKGRRRKTFSSNDCIGRDVGAVLTNHGHTLVTANYARVYVWDFRSAKCLRSLKHHSAKINVLHALSDQKHVISGSDDKTMRVWEVDSGACLHVLKGHTSSVLCITTLPCGWIVSSGSDNTLCVWDIDQDQRVMVIKRSQTSPITMLDTLVDGRVVGVSNSGFEIFQ